jgi:hypothetical protein
MVWKGIGNGLEGDWQWFGNAFEAVCVGFTYPWAMPGHDKVLFLGPKLP